MRHSFVLARSIAQAPPPPTNYLNFSSCPPQHQPGPTPITGPTSRPRPGIFLMRRLVQCTVIRPSTMPPTYLQANEQSQPVTARPCNHMCGSTRLLPLVAPTIHSLCLTVTLPRSCPCDFVNLPDLPPPFYRPCDIHIEQLLVWKTVRVACGPAWPSVAEVARCWAMLCAGAINKLQPLSKRLEAVAAEKNPTAADTPKVASPHTAGTKTCPFLFIFPLRPLLLPEMHRTGQFTRGADRYAPPASSAPKTRSCRCRAVAPLLRVASLLAAARLKTTPALHSGAPTWLVHVKVGGLVPYVCRHVGHLLR